MTEYQNPSANAPQQAAPEGLMADTFETDEVSATRGREQGLGMGERELQAQRDPGVDASMDPAEVETDDADEDQDEVEALDGDLAVQGDEVEQDGAGV